MALFARRPTDSSSPTPSAEKRLRSAAIRADQAAQDLALALADRHAAVADLVLATASSHRPVVKAALSASVVLRCLTGLGRHLGLPQVRPKHRLSFAQNAEALLLNSRAGRSPAEPAIAAE